MARVIVAMSGGVDSSVAACLLREAGHDVIGVFMRHGQQSVQACRLDGSDSPLLPVLGGAGLRQGCCSAADAMDARRVADLLDIPFYALDLDADFARIVDYFVSEYARGRTPNPCVMCNHWIKFGRLFAYADAVGAEYVATGHYARLAATAEGTALLRGLDQEKDQSYVLFGIEPSLLPRMLLPVGEYRKEEVRELARRYGLPVAEKPDSQEICFVSPGKHGHLVQQRWQEDLRGDLVTVDGRVVGKHPGIQYFTVGQRKGIGVAMGEPHYVVAIDAASRRVVIGPRQALQRRHLSASGANWLVDGLPEEFQCQVQIRYNSRPMAATVRPLPEQRRFEVHFHEACYGVAPGQAAVCYQGDRVLGGGWID